MTVAVGIPVFRYDGNDSATNFPFTQIFHDTADLVVIRTDTGGNNITLVEDTDYTVNGVDTTSGSVDFPIAASSYYPDPLATGYQLTIIRASDKSRVTDMSAVFFFDDMNLGEDKTVMMVQELAEQLSRCSKYTADNSATPPDLEDLISVPLPDKGNIVFNLKSTAALAIGVKDTVVYANFAGNMTRADMISMLDGVEQVGDLDVEIYNNGVKISASEPVSLSATSEVNNITLTGWTTAFVAGDKFTAKVVGTPSVVQNVDIYIRFDATGV